MVRRHRRPKAAQLKTAKKCHFLREIFEVCAQYIYNWWKWKNFWEFRQIRYIYMSGCTTTFEKQAWITAQKSGDVDRVRPVQDFQLSGMGDQK